MVLLTLIPYTLPFIDSKNTLLEVPSFANKILSIFGPLPKSNILDQLFKASHLAQNEKLKFPPILVVPKSLYT